MALKTASTTAWAKAQDANLYLTGNEPALATDATTTWAPATASPMTNTAGVFTFQFTATITGIQFQVLPTNTGWTGQYGWSAIVDGTTAHTANTVISNVSTNIGFTAVVGTKYTVHVDETQSTYTTNGTPTVWVTTP